VFSTGCPGWYATESGRITTVWVGSHVEYRRRTRFFDPTPYNELQRSERAGAGHGSRDQVGRSVAEIG
jgi:hypothetical protein